jgi:ABC1 atypical kinase-like domain
MMMKETESRRPFNQQDSRLTLLQQNYGITLRNQPRQLRRKALAIGLTVLVALDRDAVVAWMEAPRLTRYQSTKLHQAATSADITVSASSARLNKAKRLLEEFTTTSMTMENHAANLETGIDAASGRRPPTTSVTSDADWLEWNNGHLLQGRGDYVTRWAAGVKVAEPLVKYDPVATEKLLFRQPAKWLVRNVQIAVPLGIWAINVVLDAILSGKQSEAEQKQRRQARAKQLTGAISGLGPAIIKGGQALASRPDLLPAEYLTELQKLQDDVPRFRNDVAIATVEKELGLPFDEIFELIEPEPIAAASIGQVYKARLRVGANGSGNGDLVALKIQRPRCEEIIALDLYILRWWSGLYNGIFEILRRDIDLQAVIDDFGELIYREIDYVAEAANAQRFNELYAGVKDVFVPRIYSELTTSKVLTMEVRNSLLASFAWAVLTCSCSLLALRSG